METRKNGRFESHPLRHFGRDETVWMIRVMGWIPRDFPNVGVTALMRCRFNEAIAAFSLQDAVREATALRDAETTPQAGVDPWAGAAAVVPAEVGVDPRADPAEVGMEQVEIMSHSSTELIPSEAEDEEMVLVELPETTSGCVYHELSPADPPSADRGSEDTPRGPPSVDPEDEPENKRRRPRSCLKSLTSPHPC